MKYMSGLEVVEGDIVAVHHDGEFVEGVVLKVILPNTPDAEAWASPDGGVLIEGGGLGLSVHKHVEKEANIFLARRAGRRVGAIKYMSGIEVMEGDVVAVLHNRESDEGVVLKVILPDTPDAEEWQSPRGGVLIEGGGLGLFVTATPEDDEDLVFVRRANDKP